MSQKQKEQTQTEIPLADLGYQVPDTSSALSSIQQALQGEHQEEEENDKKKGKTKRKRPSSTICCCGNAHCSIGPFNEIQGEDSDK